MRQPERSSTLARLWAQRAVGIKLPQPKLPNAEPGGELEWVRGGSEPRRQPLSSTPRRTKRADGARPETHPLLVGVREHSDRAREARGNEYVRPYKKTLVDIFVSKEMIDSAIEAANKLFLALEERGMKVMLAPRGHQHLPAQLRMGEKPDPRHEYYYYHSTGRWQPGSPTIVVIETRETKRYPGAKPVRAVDGATADWQDPDFTNAPKPALT